MLKPTYLPVPKSAADVLRTIPHLRFRHATRVERTPRGWALGTKISVDRVGFQVIIWGAGVSVVDQAGICRNYTLIEQED